MKTISARSERSKEVIEYILKTVLERHSIDVTKLTNIVSVNLTLESSGGISPWGVRRYIFALCDAEFLVLKDSVIALTEKGQQYLKKM